MIPKTSTNNLYRFQALAGLIWAGAFFFYFIYSISNNAKFLKESEAKLNSFDEKLKLIAERQRDIDSVKNQRAKMYGYTLRDNVYKDLSGSAVIKKAEFYQIIEKLNDKIDQYQDEKLKLEMENAEASKLTNTDFEIHNLISLGLSLLFALIGIIISRTGFNKLKNKTRSQQNKTIRREAGSNFPNISSLGEPAKG
jgi:hypothetical protein